MPQEQKLKPEEKVEIVRRYLKGEIGINEASRKMSVNKETIRQWIANYEVEGVEAFLSNKRKRNYDAELKEKAVREYLSGGSSLLAVSKKYGLHSTCQLRDWIKVYNAHGDFSSVKFSGGGSSVKAPQIRNAPKKGTKPSPENRQIFGAKRIISKAANLL